MGFEEGFVVSSFESGAGGAETTGAVVGALGTMAAGILGILGLTAVGTGGIVGALRPGIAGS